MPTPRKKPVAPLNVEQPASLPEPEVKEEKKPEVLTPKQRKYKPAEKVKPTFGGVRTVSH